MAEPKIEFSAREEELINVFKETYNALYLESFSKQKLNYIKSNSNPVYEKLINNLMTPTKSYEQYQYIEGPISITKFKMEADGKPKKSFYIFGETHRDTRGHCRPNESIEFHEYLRRLSVESPSFLDVYVELSMVKKRIKIKNQTSFVNQLVANAMFKNKRLGFNATYKRESKDLDLSRNCTSYIFTQIEDTFSNCIQPKLRQVPECQLFRIHNIDIRHTWDLHKDLPVDLGLSLIDEILETGFNSEPVDIMHVMRRAIVGNNLIMDTLKMLKTGNLMNVLLMNKKVKDEIDRSYEKENITNFIKTKLTKFDTEDVDDIIDMSTILINTLQDKTLPILQLPDFRAFKEYCSYLAMLKVDLYCLSRVFKTYDIKKNNPVGAFQPVESKNIIIYTGDDHSQTYIEFLEYLRTVAGQNVRKTYEYRSPNDGEFSCVLINKPKAEPPLDPEEERRVKREEYVRFLNNSPFSVLKDMASLQGLSIPPRPSKKKLIELFLEANDTTVEVEPESKPNREEERLQYIEFLKGASIQTLKDMVLRLGHEIPPKATKNKLISLIVE